MATQSPYQKAVNAKLCLLSCPVTPVAPSIQKRKQDQGLINSIVQLKQWNLKGFLQKLYRSLSHFTSPPSCCLKIGNYIIGSAAQHKGRVPPSDLEQARSQCGDHRTRLALDPRTRTPNLLRFTGTPSSFMTTSDQELRSIIHWDDDMSGRTTALGRTAKYLCSITTQRKWFAKLTATIVFNLFQFVDC